jgi:GT2 family glycosyltransferase
MVSMNNTHDFKRSIESIQKLVAGRYKIIVVDSSNTTEILEESQRLIYAGNDVLYNWEAPQGIYHSMNTGVKMCDDNSLIWFLNPGDLVTDSSVVLELIELIHKGKTQWGYGLASYDNDSRFPPRLFPRLIDNTVQSLFNGELQISHQCMLVRKESIDETGLFNTKFRIAADLDFQFRLLKMYPPSILPKHLIIVDTTGVSHNQQIRTLFESFVIRLSRPEFSVFEKLAWFLRTVIRRVISSKYLRFHYAK